MSEETQHSLELWGGVECTVNRVGNEYFEQLRRSGHQTRIDDLDRFAELGIKALRQPVIWERVAPNGLATADWEWTDRWLARERDLGIRPIVGLLHHGSGPRSTSLLDPEFPGKLAEYARAVAQRYPGVEDYTPVNEPLTTARFSALYGHWYPHARDDRSFLRALMYECQAVALAMRAIREINPSARLVQTEDLGKTFSTPLLQYQAELENERRWLSFDLLCGLVDERHPLWSYLMQHDTPKQLLAWFAENPCPPDIFGFNYYLSSERYLDDEVAAYPEGLRGGNGRHSYVDIEAARVRHEGLAGVGVLLREAWERYRRPMAITECHNGCTREEQLRWVTEIWNTCEDLRSEDVDVRAVTAWSLLGAFDWNVLVTRKNDWYEPGVFDIRSPRPRATALAHLARSFGHGIRPEHPLLEVPGWWHRPERYTHESVVTDSGRRIERHGLFAIANRHQPAVRPLLITGGSGTLGRAFARACQIRGIPYKLTLRSEMDIADGASVAGAIRSYDPWAIINTAGYVRVDEAEADDERCMRENADGPITLAEECARVGTQLVTFSSDLVFDGIKRTGYVESDLPNPLNVYGRSKLEGEVRVLQRLPSALVVRTSAFFGPWDRYNFVTLALNELATGREFVAAYDAVVSPTYIPDLVEHTLDLLIDEEQGIWHLANAGAISWYELAQFAAQRASVSVERLLPAATADLSLPARRPLYSVLNSERAWIMPTLESAMDRYLAAREPIIITEAEAA